MLLDLVLVAVGVALLAKAADEFVVGAARIAIAARLSPVLVGAVIVGFGTSAPEMLVSGIAAANEDAEIGVGNIVGSNVANLTLVLGAAALIVPVTILGTTLRREAPLMVAAVVLFGVLVQDGLDTTEGLFLLAALVVSLGLIVYWGRTNPESELTAEVEEFLDGEGTHPLPREALRTLLGLIGTVIGAQLLVEGAVGIADELGLSGGFVGFTLVAIGTSLPELVTAIAAARKGEVDLIVGNLLGSNIFNALAVGAVVGIIGAGPIDADRLVGVGVISMVVVAVVAWAIMAHRRRVHRWEGVLLLVGYVATVALIGPTG
ncbi:MAG TPA: calcium/sodium antiporter [Acidimicrobiales bacterium]|nr:calcium/sodium antiporter [Acidimicrobiales bacterium]